MRAFARQKAHFVAASGGVIAFLTNRFEIQEELPCLSKLLK
jgi:hypothetical protein